MDPIIILQAGNMTLGDDALPPQPRENKKPSK